MDWAGATHFTWWRWLPQLCRASYSLWGHSRHFISSYSAVQKSAVKDCVVAVLVHATPDHVYLFVHCSTTELDGRRAHLLPHPVQKLALPHLFQIRKTSGNNISFTGQQTANVGFPCPVSRSRHLFASYLETVMSFGGFRLLSQSRDAVYVVNMMRLGGCQTQKSYSSQTLAAFCRSLVIE